MNGKALALIVILAVATILIWSARRQPDDTAAPMDIQAYSQQHKQLLEEIGHGKQETD